jgi:hypothetical protein
VPDPSAAGEERPRDPVDLLSELVALSRDLARQLPRTSALADALRAVDRLDREPLRIALLGRPGTGALLLAEAMLERQVFGRGALRTVAGPVTFRFADDEGVTVTDETAVRTELTRLPVGDADWPTEPSTARAVDVRLRAPRLRRMSLVVAPSLPDSAVSAAVVVDREPAEAHALGLLDRFNDRSRGLEATAFAAMAVQRTDDVRAEHAVERQREHPPGAGETFSLVLPINLVLAHTARVGAFDAAALDALTALLGRADALRRVAQGVFDPTLKRLLTAEGLRACLPALRDRALTERDVREVALAASGFGAFDDAVQHRWLGHVDALKVASARGVLGRATARSAAVAHQAERNVGLRLGAHLAAIDPDRLRRLDEIQVLHLLDEEPPLFSAADAAAARRLLGTTRPRVRLARDSGVVDSLETLVLRWRALADNGVGGDRQRWAAGVVLHSAEALREGLTVGSAGGSP